MSALNLAPIKAAIHNWVVKGSGLAGDHVVWTLGKRRPSGTYIHLRLRLTPIGQDLNLSRRNPTPTSGDEAINYVLGARLLTVVMTCFAPDTPDQGVTSPEQILNDVATAYSLPSVLDVIAAARIGWLNNTEITSIDLTIDSSLFEPRATITYTFHAVVQLNELGPAIDTVEITGDLPSGDETFEVSDP